MTISEKTPQSDAIPVLIKTDNMFRQQQTMSNKAEDENIIEIQTVDASASFYRKSSPSLTKFEKQRAIYRPGQNVHNTRDVMKSAVELL